MKSSFIPQLFGVGTLLLPLICHGAPAIMDPGQLLIAQICNYTESTIYGAIGYYQDGEKHSEGWYRIRPYRCTTLGEDLDGPIYLYAQTEDGDKRWIPREGYATRRFCTSDYVDEDYFFRGTVCDSKQGREHWFGRVIDSNKDGYALFNIYE